MEICVNEYIRTDSGELFKVIDVEKGSVKIKSDYREWIGMCCIINHSKNIIDLIEVGDYVNGRRVLEIERTKNNEIEICILKGNIFSDWTTINDKNIKSIVTKEQFASMEYRVKHSN